MALTVRTPIIVALVVAAGSVSCPRPQSEQPRPRVRENPVEALTDQLKDPAWGRRAEATSKLGATRSGDAVTPLAGAVGDTDHRVRLAAVIACGMHGSPKLIPALKQALARKEKPLRRQAVRALAKIGTREAAEAMIEALDGESAWLRPEVADGLVRVGAKVLEKLEVAIQILVAELDPKHKARFRRLRKALAALGEPALEALLRLMDKPHGPHAVKRLPTDMKCVRGPCRVLVSMGAPVVPKLIRMAQGGVQNIAGWTLYNMLLPAIFSRIGAPALPHVTKLFGKRGFEGKLAENTLDKMGPAALPALVTLLTKPGPGLSARAKVTALMLVREIRDRRVLPLLTKAATGSYPLAQAVAAKGLATYWPKASRAALTKLLQTGPKSVRLAIVEGAGFSKDPQAHPLLIVGLNQSELDVTVSAVRALGRRKDPKGYKPLARYSRRGKKQVRLVAIEALGKLGTVRAKKLLARLKRSKDKSIAQAASRALQPTRVKSAAASLGIPVCDRYLKAMWCYLNKLPAAARGPSKAAFKKTVAAWKKMASGPARGSLAKVCVLSHDAVRKSILSIPRYSSCLRP